MVIKKKIAFWSFHAIGLKAWSTQLTHVSTIVPLNYKNDTDTNIAFRNTQKRWKQETQIEVLIYQMVTITHSKMQFSPANPYNMQYPPSDSNWQITLQVNQSMPMYSS